jgi:hypothetical protein
MKNKLMINRRKAILASGAVMTLPLLSCSGTTESNTTVSQIVAAIQSSCGFVTTANAIIPVILSLLSSFNAAAGAGATVATALGQQVVDAVCMAIKAHPAAAGRSETAAASQPIVVNVNGVNVPGHLVGPKTLSYKPPA